MPYRSLKLEPIIETIELLRRRVSERFPVSGLHEVSTELLETARGTRDRISRIGRPHLGLRVASWSILVALFWVLYEFARHIRVEKDHWTLSEALAISDGAFNTILVLGGAVLFLVSWERRWRRRNILAALYELRSLAHVVDMHQLTKDPHYALHPQSKHTPSSPQRTMTPFEVKRYLDYCSEMFSLISKLGAVYVERSDDPVVMSTVNDIDALTAGLSSKVWRKITILESGGRQGETLRRMNEAD